MIRKRLMTEVNLTRVNSKRYHNHLLSYSEEMRELFASKIGKRYSKNAQEAACTIQRAYRQYRFRIQINHLAGTYRETTSRRRSRSNCSHRSMPDKFDYSSFTSSIYSNVSSSHENAHISTYSSSDSNNTELYGSDSRSMIGDEMSHQCDELLEQHGNNPCSTSSMQNMHSNQHSSDDSSSAASGDGESSRESSPASSRRRRRSNSPLSVNELPPAMPVINTQSLLQQCYTRDADASVATSDNNNNNHYRSPRDSGVSSHSSNIDLDAAAGAGAGASINNSNCLHQLRCGTLPLTNKESTTPHRLSSQIGCISEDTDSLFDNNNSNITNPICPLSVSAIPAIMTNSKDSGVDADSSNIQLQQIAVVTKNNNHNDCTASVHTGQMRNSLTLICIGQPAGISNQLNSPTNKIQVESTNQITPVYNELTIRILHRISVNLFNRNISVGLDYISKHRLFNVNSPWELSAFIRNRDVHPFTLCEFLGNPLYYPVLRCYLDSINIKRMSFLDAFELFSSLVKLPQSGNKVQYLLSEFSSYYLRLQAPNHTQSPNEIHGDIKGNSNHQLLINIARVILLLKSTSKCSTSAASSSGFAFNSKKSDSQMSFNQFAKQISVCFKNANKPCPYAMDMLHKTYLSVTRIGDDHGNTNPVSSIGSCHDNINNNPPSIDLGLRLIGCIDHLDDNRHHYSVARTTTTGSNAIGYDALSRGYFLANHRRLIHWQQINLLIPSSSNNKKSIGSHPLIKYQRHRSLLLLVFNDSLVITKSSSNLSTPISIATTTTTNQLHSCSIGSTNQNQRPIINLNQCKLLCKLTLSFVNYQIDFQHTKLNPSEIKLQSTMQNHVVIDCLGDIQCAHLLNRLLLVQLECRTVEYLRLHQWRCTNESSSNMSASALNSIGQCYCCKLIGNTLGYLQHK